mgnify:CR=1 FL=1
MKMLLPVLLMLATGKTILPGEVKVKTLPPESREVLDYLPRNIVIAHRGTTYWAPEETEAAMRWARTGFTTNERWGIDCSARCQSEAYDEC